MNPVTFRGKGDRESGATALTLARVHLSFDDGPFSKTVTAVLSNEPAGIILGSVALDEQTFIDGMKLLFQRGELG